MIIARRFRSKNVLIISDKTLNSDPPWCKYVNEDTECEDSLAKEMCQNACRRFEGNYSNAFIFKFCDWNSYCKHM